jgi:hypothetical protein
MYAADVQQKVFFRETPSLSIQNAKKQTFG